MDVYLIRHGIAAEPETYANDEERPLTDKGDKRTRQVAKRLRELGLYFDLILSSPLVRARQTAKILQVEGLGEDLQESAHLAPDGDFHAWLNWWNQWRQQSGDRTLALVGHQPNLTNWAEILVWGAIKEKIILKKAGVIGLNLPKIGSPVGNSEIFWLTSPKFLLP